MPSINPLEYNAIIEAANATGAIVTAGEQSIMGGLGSAICRSPCRE
ncbi:hypothetical protein [Lentibacillus salinarum]|uniref:Uncharacterized protein n=1 Tax=Lentibacillus salinarum TaxID=446820 RepID=A0ABW3ZW16_9BACI